MAAVMRMRWAVRSLMVSESCRALRVVLTLTESAGIDPSVHTGVPTWTLGSMPADSVSVKTTRRARQDSETMRLRTAHRILITAAIGLGLVLLVHGLVRYVY